MNLDRVDILDCDGPRGPVALTLADGEITDIRAVAADPAPRPLILPMPIDLQVNGGGGLMVNDTQSPADLHAIARAHRALGTGAILPTLISDTAETTRRILQLAIETDGALGLHLEGPHLQIAGAHDPTVLRPLTEADLTLYANAAQRLPQLMLTLAPEMASPDQINRLARAGVIVALGHSDCSYEMAQAAIAAGARMVTHLFNAMSGLHHRMPGLVGAALDSDIAFGIIADGHHVHNAALRLAHRLGRNRMIPVSDAMALTGSDAASFTFQNRVIQAEATRLTLPDGTLAGARASLIDGLRHLAHVTGTPLGEMLLLGSTHPANLLGHEPARIAPGVPADLLRLWPDGRLEVLAEGVWTML